MNLAVFILGIFFTVKTMLFTFSKITLLGSLCNYKPNLTEDNFTVSASPFAHSSWKSEASSFIAH